MSLTKYGRNPQFESARAYHSHTGACSVLARIRTAVRLAAISCLDPVHENQNKISSLQKPKTGVPVNAKSFKALISDPQS
jgi:hypothetical protein